MRIEQNKPADYISRVNRAIDFILGGLEQPLQLEAVAQIAGFSACHFHRIFRSLVGETLSQFVKRLRLERALSLMSQAKPASLTEIALACGFASSSDFSRTFKQRYGVPPSAFDVATYRAHRREDPETALVDPRTRHLLERLPVGENPDGFEVTLRRLPARRVAYIRVMDPYRPEVVAQATKRLIEWAQGRGLADGQWLGYMWDDPEIVDRAKCRYDIAVEVSEVVSEGEVCCHKFPAMQVAELELRGGIDLEMRALDWLFKTWLPTSGFLPTDQPSFEAFIGRPFAHGEEYFELRAQLPVVRE